METEDLPGIVGLNGSAGRPLGPPPIEGEAMGLKNAGPPKQLLTRPAVDPRHTPAGRDTAIPASAAGAIKASVAEAQDGATAGSEGLSGKHPAGGQSHNIPGRDRIVPPSGFHVP